LRRPKACPPRRHCSSSRSQQTKATLVKATSKEQKVEAGLSAGEQGKSNTLAQEKTDAVAALKKAEADKEFATGLKKKHLRGQAAQKVEKAVDCVVDKAKKNITSVTAQLVTAQAANGAVETTLKSMSAKADSAKSVAAKESQQAIQAQKSATLAADVATEQTNEANQLAATASKLTEKAQTLAGTANEKVAAAKGQMSEAVQSQDEAKTKQEQAKIANAEAKSAAVTAEEDDVEKTEATQKAAARSAADIKTSQESP